MATALVDHATNFLEGDTFSVINTLATKNVVAMVDGGAQSLYIGASKDVNMQASEGFNIQMGSSNALVVTDNANVASFKIETDPTTTRLSAVEKNLVLTTTNTSNSIILGDIQVGQSNNYQVVNTSMPNGFLMDDNLKLTGYNIVDQNLSVGGNVVCNGSWYAQNYNFVKYYPSASNPTDPKILGYAFHVNDSDQLELLKHTTFSNGIQVSKRVGVFGAQALNIADRSDAASYEQFDNIGTLTIGSNSNLATFSAGQTEQAVLDNTDAKIISTTSAVSVLTNASPNSAVAQWGALIDGLYFDSAWATSTDSNDNVYICGIFSIVNGVLPTIRNADGTVSSVTLNPSTASGKHGYVVKYDASGTAQWIASVHGTNSDSMCLAIDQNNNVVMTGTYSGSVQVYNSNGEASTLSLPVPTSYGLFIVKYDTNGTALWTTLIDGVDGEFPYATVCDANGNIYIGSYYYGGNTPPTMYNVGGLASTQATLRTVSSTAGFLVKYDSSGTALWAASIDGPGWDEPFTLDVDLSGHVFMSGKVESGAIVYSAGNLPSTSINLVGSGGFVVKYDPNGVALWGIVMTGFNGSYVKCAPDGSVYTYSRYTSFGVPVPVINADGTSSMNLVASTNYQAGGVVKYNSLGVAQWAVTVRDLDSIYDATVDNQGNLYIPGKYVRNTNVVMYNATGVQSDITFPNTGNVYVSFVIKVSPSGVILSAFTYKGDAEWSRIACDTKNSIYIAATFKSLSLYNSDGSASDVIVPSPPEYYGVFLFKYNQVSTYKLASLEASSMNAQWGALVYGPGYYPDLPVLSITTDSNDNVYVCGGFTYGNGALPSIKNTDGSTSSVQLSPNTASGTHGYLLKYDKNGMAQWIATVHAPSNMHFSMARSVRVDTNNNVYITGQYKGSVQIYDSSGQESTLSLRVPSSHGVFIVKFNSGGTGLWSAVIDGTQEDSPTGIVSDAMGNIYTTGYYYTNAPTIYDASGLPSTQVTLTRNSPQSIFLVKYNSSGTALWAASIDGPGYGHSSGLDIDPSGNIFLTGYLNDGKTVYNAGNMVNSSVNLSGSGAFLIKYNSSGIAQWGILMNGHQSSQVKCSPDGSVYSLSEYISTGTLAPVMNAAGTSTLTLVASTTQYAGCVIKYNTLGVAQWAVSLHDAISVSRLSIDLLGNLYIPGSYYQRNIVLYDAGGVQSGITLPYNANEETSFVIKVAPHGVIQSAFTFTGTTSYICITNDSQNNIYVATTTRHLLSLYNSDGTPSDVSFTPMPLGYYNSLFKYNQVSAYDGFEKTLINTSSYQSTVLIRDSTDTNTLSTLQLAPNSTQTLVWYDPMWYV